LGYSADDIVEELWAIKDAAPKEADCDADRYSDTYLVSAEETWQQTRLSSAKITEEAGGHVRLKWA